MKKKIIAVAVAMLAVNSVAFAAGMLFSGSKIIISGQEASFENQIYNENGRLYVPLREFCDKINTPVLWDEEKNSAFVLSSNEFLLGADTEKKDVIPDEETAKSIGKIIMEKYMGRKLENNMHEFYAYPVEDLWCVQLVYSEKSHTYGGDMQHLVTIRLSRKTGAAVFISTNSDIDLDEDFGDDEVIDNYGNIRKKLEVSAFDFTCAGMSYEELKSKAGIPDKIVKIDEEEHYAYELMDGRIVVFGRDVNDNINRIWLGSDKEGEIEYVMLDVNKNITQQLKKYN